MIRRAFNLCDASHRLRRHALFSGDHGPHHVAGVFGVVGDGADGLGQPDGVEQGDGVFLEGENPGLEFGLLVVGLMFHFAQVVDDVFQLSELRNVK